MRSEFLNKGTTAYKAALLSLFLLGSAACTHPRGHDDLNGEVLAPQIGWDELVFHLNDVEPAAPEQHLNSSPVVQLTHQQLLIPASSYEGQKAGLMGLPLVRLLNKPHPYEKGIFGTLGTAKVYLTTTDRIGHFDRLYWVIVKVLSEKYGCFMVTKQTRGNVTQFTCRDKRRIVFWRDQMNGWMKFYARQYDQDGHEIVVKNRKIVRIGEKHVI